MLSPTFKLFLFCFTVLFIEKALFWLYLWQLKNYHLKRFLAHFATHQGKRLLLNLQNILLVSGILWLVFITLLKEKAVFTSFYALGVFILNLGLVFLCFKTFFNFIKLKTKKPVLTKKSGLLVLSSFLIGFIFALIFSPFQENAIFAFLVILFLEPILVSGIVLILEPLTVFKRKQILKKATQKRANLPNLQVIAITGSYGKTSVKEYLYQILKEKFSEEAVVKTEKHINAEIGIAQTILNKVNERTKIFIVEVGAYEIGKIKEVCKMIKPNVSVLTGINNQHLATFGSQENIIKAKFEVIDALKNGGVAIFNLDSPLTSSKFKVQSAKLNEGGIKTIACSTKQEADIMAADIMVEKETVSFKAFTKAGSTAQFNLKALGKTTIENVLLAIAAAKEFSVSLKEVTDVLSKNNLNTEALQLLKKENRDLLLTDYSSNLTGVLADLEHLKLWGGKKIIVMPCLIELGVTAKETHFKIGEGISKVCDLAIITSADYFKALKEGAKKTTERKAKIIFLTNPQKIKNEIDFLLKGNKSEAKDSVVLIEGRSSRKIVEAIVK